MAVALLLLPALLGLFIPSSAQGVLPDCVFKGRDFANVDQTPSGAEDWEDITSSCPGSLGPALSIAFTVRPDVTTWTYMRIVDFKKASGSSIVCYLEQASLGCLTTNDLAAVTKVVSSSNTVAPGDRRRYLLSVSDQATATLYEDGVVVGSVGNFDIAPATRSLWVGRSHHANGLSLWDGLIEDVFIWYDQAVDWASAAITTTTTTTPTTRIDCIYPGRHFQNSVPIPAQADADWEDITSRCPSGNMGPAFSIAFTVQPDVVNRSWARIVDFGGGHLVHQIVCAQDNEYVKCASYHAGSYQGDILTSSVPSLVGSRNRYLLSVDQQESATLYQDGVVVATGSLQASSMSRMLWIAQSHDNNRISNFMGTIEDVYVWYNNAVEWSSAVTSTTTTTTTTTRIWVPDCIYHGRGFTNTVPIPAQADSDWEDITSLCPNGVMGPAFSIAVTVQPTVVDRGWARVVDFAAGHDEHHIICALDSTNFRCATVHQRAHDFLTPTDTGLAAGDKRRYLLSVDQQSFATLYEDGVVVATQSVFQAQPVARSFWIAQSQDDNRATYFNGNIEEVYLWYDKSVDWSSAVGNFTTTTTTTRIWAPDCTYRGRDFSNPVPIPAQADSDWEDITSLCPSGTMGPAFSIAVTVQPEVVNRSWARVVDFAAGHDSHHIICAVDNTNFQCATVHNGVHHYLMPHDLGLSIDDKRRYLLSVDEQSFATLYQDGVVVARAGFFGAAPVSRTFWIGQSQDNNRVSFFDGKIEDVNIWYDKAVGWDNAAATFTTTKSTLSSTASSTSRTSTSSTYTVTSTVTLTGTATETSTKTVTGTTTETSTETSTLTATATMTGTDTSTTSDTVTSTVTLTGTATETSTETVTGTTTETSTETSSTTLTGSSTGTGTGTTSSSITAMSSTVAAAVESTAMSSSSTVAAAVESSSGAFTSAASSVEGTANPGEISTTLSLGVSSSTSSMRLTSSSTTPGVAVTDTSLSEGMARSSSSTSNAESSTGTSQTWTTSLTETTQTSTRSTSSSHVDDVQENPLASLEADVQKALALLANSSGGSGSLRTELGNLSFYSTDWLLGKATREPVFMPGGVQVALPRSFLWSLPQGAVVTALSLENGSYLENITGQETAVPALDLTIFDTQGQKVRHLTEPLLFRLPNGARPLAGQHECVFLDELNGRFFWSTAGVRRATSAEVLAAGGVDTGTWCVTNHLSLFSAILQVILGCTNLDMLSVEGMSAVVDHEGWWQARPAALTFAAVAVFSVFMFIGAVRECWALRLGRTHEAEKKVKLCKAFVKIGPQMLKHRYAVFVVYVKDVLHCLSQGRDKLRLPTLKQGVQRSLAVRTGISTGCISQHCWNGGGWLTSQASLPHTVLCKKLEFYAGAVESVLETELFGCGPHHIFRRFIVNFLACHPFLDSLRLGASSMSVKKRSTLQLAAFLGVLATNAMIFNFSGELKSWEAPAACPISPGSHLFVVVATIVSILLNVLPNQFLLEVAKQVHGRPWWKAAFWALALLYLLMSALFVILALANLNPKDQLKWHYSMQWSMCFKFVGMPAAQALRNSILLEHFLQESGDTRSMATTLGLKHPNEANISVEEEEAAQMSAMRAISAEELVKFTALLGDGVMPDFSPETSTSEDVLRRAVRHFCSQPSEEELSLSVDVSEMRGLPTGARRYLSCAVLHLGALSRQERLCIAEQASSSLASSAEGSCSWRFKAELAGFEHDHALGFLVSEGKKVLGVACLALEDLVKSKGFDGELRLHPPAGGDVHQSFSMPPSAAHVVGKTSPPCGSLGSGTGIELLPQACLSVKVGLPPEFLPALASLELRKCRGLEPIDSSNVGAAEVTLKVHKTDLKSQLPYCNLLDEGSLPADKIVVHSRQGNFIGLVAALLADALGDAVGNEGALKAVHTKLLNRDFHAILDLLRQNGRLNVRYWLDLFATPYDAVHLRRPQLRSMPTIVRSLRRACCERMVSDIRAGAEPSCGAPAQLIVLDESCQLLRESASMAEVMQVNAMSLEQRVLLRPEHFKGTVLVDALQRMVKGKNDAKQLPWTLPFVEDKTAVQQALVELVVQAIRLRGDDEEAILQDLHPNSVGATVVASLAARAQNADTDIAGEMGDEPAAMGT